MNRITDEIRQHMAQKSTDELLTIWKENDRDSWSEDAFKAVKDLLIERGIELPEQRPYPSKSTEATRAEKLDNRGKSKSRVGKCERLLGGMGGVGVLLIAFLYFFAKGDPWKPEGHISWQLGLIMVLSPLVGTVIGRVIGGFLDSKFKKNKTD